MRIGGSIFAFFDPLSGLTKVVTNKIKSYVAGQVVWGLGQIIYGVFALDDINGQQNCLATVDPDKFNSGVAHC